MHISNRQLAVEVARDVREILDLLPDQLELAQALTELATADMEMRLEQITAPTENIIESDHGFTSDR